MGALLNAKLSYLFFAGSILCTGQSERAAAMQWADYYATAYRVPPELVHAIIEVESAWQAHAFSSKGAAGLMHYGAVADVFFESGGLDGDPVRAGIQGGNVVGPFGSGDCIGDELRAGIDDGDFGPGDNGSGGIGRCADDARGSGGLGQGATRTNGTNGKITFDRGGNFLVDLFLRTISTT